MNQYTKTAASVDTFLEQQKQKKLKCNAHRVYRALTKSPGSTKNELITALGLPHQTVTSRLSFLMDLGIVAVSGKRTTIAANGTSYESHFIPVTDQNKIQQNIKNRLNLKLTRLKRQLKQYKEIMPADALAAIQAAKF